jgi:4-carboxymuconolactone decarboxylase
MFELVNTYAPAEAKNVYRKAAIDVVFGQVWTRPGLSRRQRRWVSLTGAGLTGTQTAMTVHVYGALNSGDISAEEMGEFLLHFCCYAGFPKATMVDGTVNQALERIAAERGRAPDRAYTPLPDTPLEDLASVARDTRAVVLGSQSDQVPHGTPASDLLAGALLYGHAWSRPQLPRSDRRLITITCLASLGLAAALRAHLAASLESGDLGEVTLREVALHAGLYCGLAAGLAIDEALRDLAAGPPETSLPAPAGAGIDHVIQDCT